MSSIAHANAVSVAQRCDCTTCGDLGPRRAGERRTVFASAQTLHRGGGAKELPRATLGERYISVARHGACSVRLTMARATTLVIYYSKTELTAKAAEAIAGALGCDIARIEDDEKGRSVPRCLTRVLDAVLRRTPKVRRLEHDPSEYDLVLVGTPVWSGLVPTAIRSYLERNRGRFKRVAFFLTHADRGARGVLDQMAELCGARPFVILMLRNDELEKERPSRKIQAFARQIARQIAPPLPHPAVA